MFPEGVHSLSHSSFLREKFPDLTVMLWQLQASDLIGQKQVQEGSCQPAVPLIYLEYFPSDFCIDSLVMKQHILTTNMSTVIGSSPSLFRVFSSWNKKKGKTNLSFGERVPIPPQSLSLFYVTVMVVRIRRTQRLKYCRRDHLFFNLFVCEIQSITRKLDLRETECKINYFESRTV